MEKQLQRAITFANLIKRKATGTPEELARKLNISASLVKKDISSMREVFGATIVFDRRRRSYVFKDGGFVKIEFERGRGQSAKEDWDEK